MRGHGRSSSPADPARYSRDATVGDMAAVLDAVLDAVGATTAIVGGLSLGGYMSLAFHRAHPERVRALLIFDTGPGFKNPKSRADWNRSAERTAAELDEKGRSALRTRSAERQLAEHRDARGLVLAARNMLTQHDATVIEWLPHIEAPTLVLVGADDEPFLAATDYMAKKIPHAEKVVIANAGHAANLDQPEAFNQSVRSFLDAHRL
ncbi:MAG TPA: alpha/beta hydrolase [Thermoanaerobaculia bacterium]|nr:alpha/beta hydrolase [Thermoanaerobaculia bacterium]